MQIGARRARPVRLSVSTGIGRLFTVVNTLAGSTLPSARVIGEPAIYAALYPREAAITQRRAMQQVRRASLNARIAQMEL